MSTVLPSHLKNFTPRNQSVILPWKIEIKYLVIYFGKFISDSLEKKRAQQ